MNKASLDKSIALYGRSGSGKSVIADHLVSRYGFQLCSTGGLCRIISKLLFGNEDRRNLNLLSQKIREIDSALWIKAALLDAKCSRVVFDSVRYESDVDYLRDRGFEIWQVSCPLEVCEERLRARGQEFNKSDMLHLMEHSLQQYVFDATIDNGHRGLELVLEDVDRALLT